MTEIELKFQVPPARADAVRRAVAAHTGAVVRLRALYVDTPDRRLAAAGLALRVRREGRRWVQTLKGRGDGLAERLEHEVPLAGTAAAPPPADPALHDGTPAGALLRAALGDDGAGMLGVRYATDIRRTWRHVRTGAALVELAFDEGRITAGGASLDVCELEFELKRGPVDALPVLAARWIDRYGLWLDVRSKAERGDALARGESARGAVHAQASALSLEALPAPALRTMVAGALAHALPNAAVVAAGLHAAEHLHQLRVALRRLRTVLRVYGGWALPESPRPADPAWQPALADAFTALGAARDRDALAGSLLPALQAAGAPTLALPEPAGGLDPGAALRSPGFSRLMVELIAFARPGDAVPAPLDPAAPTLAETAAPLLARQHRRLLRDAAQFESLDEAAQHRARKRLKRLRYSVEFTGPLWRRKPLAAYLAALKPAQEALGRYNDVLVAEAAFRARLADDPRAWFALGWLAAQRGREQAEAAAALRALRDAPRPWKHPKRP